MCIYKTISLKISNSIKQIPELSEIDIFVNIENPKIISFGDFSTNVAMQLTKILKQNPIKIAEKIVNILKQDTDIKNVEIAGSGFINISLKDDFLIKYAFLDANYKTENPQKLCLDYGSYNIGKSLHIGHLRTTIVGDTFNRISKFLGHNAISYNHMGDWGRPMGIIIAWIKEFGMPNDINELNAIYTKSSEKAKEDESWLQKARLETSKLQSNDALSLEIYDSFTSISLNYIQKLLDKLNILPFDENKGEKLASNYVDKVEKILIEKNLLEESDGAKIINVKEENDTEPMPPVMWKTSINTQTYAAADLSAIYYRKEKDNPNKIIYFTDTRQSLHFRQIFRASNLVGFKSNKDLEHIGFGTVMGKDGKPFKTRDGNSPDLDNIYNIVKDSVKKRIEESKKILDEKTINQITLASLKFNDLMHDTKSDYIFDIDSITSFEGKTGPYILYTAVRLQSILNKTCFDKINIDKVQNLNTEERNLILSLTNIPKIINLSFEKRCPSILANYTYELAQNINTFYHSCPVLSSDILEEIKEKRLNIILKSYLSIKLLLGLMGLSIPQEM